MTQTQSAWRTLETFVDTGQVRQLGISNCYSRTDLECLCAAARIKPAVIQNRFYAETNYDRDIRALCQQNQIVYQSFWTLSANPHVLAHKTLTALASTHQRTPAQILFRYLTLIGVVPLTGTQSESHMREDLAIFDFGLTHEEQGTIDALL
jgi:diketogulonate reductase-like aldo/keto reductase